MIESAGPSKCTERARLMSEQWEELRNCVDFADFKIGSCRELVSNEGPSVKVRDLRATRTLLVRRLFVSEARIAW